MKLNLNILIIGLASGLVAAILSVGSVVQNALSFILLILSPLPILLAGLGWGPVAGGLSAMACALLIAIVAGVIPATIISVTIAIPAAIAAYFSGMSRIYDNREEWYPLANIVLIVAFAVATGFVIAGYFMDDYEAFVRAFSQELAKQLASTNSELVANPDRTTRFVNFLVASIPFLQPACWFMIIMGNLWLALFIARTSGRFQRTADDWPNQLHLPVAAIALLALIALGATFSKSLGTALLCYAGTLSAAFVLTGYAFIHLNTRGKTWRPAALSLTYCITFFFGIAPIFLILGLYRTATNSRSNG